MSKSNCLVAVALLIVSSTTFAREISLHCPGTNRGNDIQTSYEPIDIQVHVPSGQIFGFPTYKAPGCGDLGGKATVESSVNENLFQTDCKNSMASSLMRLNRYSGALTITTVFFKTDAVWTGQYMCSEQKKKF